MNNFTLSFELISFLKWLLENKQDTLAQLVDDAIKSGSLKIETESQVDPNAAHKIIHEFVEFFEKKLKASIKANDVLENELREQLSELADSFDLSLFDDVAIMQGFKQAKTQIASIAMPENDYVNNHAMFKTLLISKILENWQPSKSAAEG